jgi:hypothetical protein
MWTMKILSNYKTTLSPGIGNDSVWTRQFDFEFTQMGHQPAFN